MSLACKLSWCDCRDPVRLFTVRMSEIPITRCPYPVTDRMIACVLHVRVYDEDPLAVDLRLSRVNESVRAGNVENLLGGIGIFLVR